MSKLRIALHKSFNLDRRHLRQRMAKRYQTPQRTRNRHDNKTSWNEFPERAAIEPHHDATAGNPDSLFLYNKTREYITEVQSFEK
jgi:hypothetical protein